jgi:hypothetical protein
MARGALILRGSQKTGLRSRVYTVIHHVPLSSHLQAPEAFISNRNHACWRLAKPRPEKGGVGAWHFELQPIKR